MSDVVFLECVEDGASKFLSGAVKGKVLSAASTFGTRCWLTRVSRTHFMYVSLTW